MAAVEQYLSHVPDWATSIEFVVHEPEGEQSFGDVVVPEKTLFLAATVSTPNGLFPKFLDAGIKLLGPYDRSSREPQSNHNHFVSENGQVTIIGDPRPGPWRVQGFGGRIPFALTIMAFHPEIPPKSPPSPGSTGDSPFKCRACKSTAKALALAIVAAATLPALPSALIAAVSTYLGASTVIAAAFISSVLGDTVDVISERLCRKVALC